MVNQVFLTSIFLQISVWRPQCHLALLCFINMVIKNSRICINLLIMIMFIDIIIVNMSAYNSFALFKNIHT